jgi:hypothetical protein
VGSGGILLGASSWLKGQTTQFNSLADLAPRPRNNCTSSTAPLRAAASRGVSWL